jgi:hypothetical protein
MQTLGTEWGRDQIHPNLWVNLAKNQYDADIRRGEHYVFDDIRFENECCAILELGGLVVRVERPNVAYSVDGHASEQLIYQPGVHVVNNGAKEELLDKFREEWRKL